jgi:ribosomal-protein-alanine N-acetyltransferase
MSAHAYSHIRTISRYAWQVIEHAVIRLATAPDAQRIAELSRDLIETGLGWAWTPERVAATMRRADTNVAVAQLGQTVIGFGIMKYKDEEAYLHLLAVHPAHQRMGVGSALMAWMEKTARTAGIGLIYLEARLANHAGRAFYQKLGYREIKIVPRMYRGVEDGVRIGKDLWVQE